MTQRWNQRISAFLTDDSREALSTARAEAQQLGHNFISSEHLLLGLLGNETSTAYTILKDLEVDLQNLRAAVNSTFAPGPGWEREVAVPFDESAQLVFQGAYVDARRFGHRYIGTEHLLLGIARNRKSQAGRLLRRCGADLDELRETILWVLGAEQKDGAILDEALRNLHADDPSVLLLTGLMEYWDGRKEEAVSRQDFEAATRGSATNSHGSLAIWSCCWNASSPDGAGVERWRVRNPTSRTCPGRRTGGPCVPVR